MQNFNLHSSSLVSSFKLSSFQMSKILSYYGQYLRRHTRPFKCPVCEIFILPINYERHCDSCQHLNANICCVWCFGKVSWPARKKYTKASHLLECCKQCLAESEGSNRYHTHLDRNSKIPFVCPHCPEILVAKEFEKHCSERHGFNARLCCVWCFGGYAWEVGRKNRHVEHLIQCFEMFMARKPPLQTHVQPRVLSRVPLCPPRDFMGHENLSEMLHPLAFESFRVLDHGRRVLYFEDANLNAAASYVRLFQETRNNVEWFHVMVKAVAIDSFIEAVNHRYEEGVIETLPFWCWCDGGPHSEARFRQHRHMIVACRPRGFFKRHVWNRVFPSQRPVEGFRWKVSQPVESAMHLVNVMGYVCKRQSRCTFNVGTKRGRLSDRHFYIENALPEDYLLPLCLQWKGGLMRMLYQEKFQNVSVKSLEKSTLVFENDRYKQKMKHFYGFERGWVLPVQKVYAPAPSRSTADAYLLEDEKLYFEYSSENENLDRAAWLRRQVEGGNCFYEVVGEKLWTPRPRDQAQLNHVMPIWQAKRRLESESENLREENKSLKDKMNVMESKHNEQIEKLKGGLQVLREENKSLKRKHDEELISLKEEVKDLKRKMERNMISENFFNHVTVNIHNYGEKRSKSAPPSL